MIRSKIVPRLIQERKNLARKRLKNKDFSIISSNCYGGIICSDLGVRFNSPFVNLWVEPTDFLKILRDIRHYMDAQISFIDAPDFNYPVGKIDDVKIYFQHYKSREEAKKKWEERKKRINYDNIFVIFTDRDGCTYDMLKEFDKIPIDNKIVFTHKKYNDIKSSIYIKGFENDGQVGMCFKYKNSFSIKRRYDIVDYVKWFNKGIIRKTVL